MVGYTRARALARVRLHACVDRTAICDHKHSVACRSALESSVSSEAAGACKMRWRPEISGSSSTTSQPLHDRALESLLRRPRPSTSGKASLGMNVAPTGAAGERGKRGRRQGHGKSTRGC